MRNAVISLIFALALALGAFLLEGILSIIIWWCALAFLIFGLSYAFNRPGILGKRSQGDFSPLLLLWLPVYWLNYVLWLCRRSRFDSPGFVQATPFLAIGPRLSAAELPEKIDQVIDLTAEFIESRSIRKKTLYHSFPILRGGYPSPEKLHTFLKSIEFRGRQSYIHCADGHGRTLLFCVAALIQKGYCPSIKEAVGLIKKVRPTAEMNDKQKAFIRCFYRGFLQK